jgi:hypothetical protein
MLIITNGEILPSPETPEDEYFFVRHTFWAFGGFYPICFFTAQSGDCLELTISSINSDPDRPDDKYIIELLIASTNHSTTVLQGTQFRDTIRLNYSDTYNVTAAKHPFYSSVTISGEVTIHHHPVPLDTDTPPTSPAIKPTLAPTESNSTNSNSSPQPTVPEFSTLAILPLSLLIIAAILYARHQKLADLGNKSFGHIRS